MVPGARSGFDWATRGWLTALILPLFSQRIAPYGGALTYSRLRRLRPMRYRKIATHWPNGGALAAAVYLRRVGYQHRIGLRSGLENPSSAAFIAPATAEGLQIEQLLHGPFCAVDEIRATLAASAPPQGATHWPNGAANAVGAPVWSLVQEGDALLSGWSTEQFILPPVPEFWSPLVYVPPRNPFPISRFSPTTWRWPAAPIPTRLRPVRPRRGQCAGRMGRPPPAAIMNCKGAENDRR